MRIVNPQIFDLAGLDASLKRLQQRGRLADCHAHRKRPTCGNQLNRGYGRHQFGFILGLVQSSLRLAYCVNEPASSVSIRHFVTAQGCPTLLGLGFNRCISYLLRVEAYFRSRNLIELPAYSALKGLPMDQSKGWTRPKVTWILPILIMIFVFVGLGQRVRAEEAAIEGRRIYIEYCASCHGLTGEGDGPVARALSTPPANLRLLSDRFGNPLPEDQVARFIDGRAEVKAHGPRDMPVWGRRFYAQTHDERAVRAMIRDLVVYLQSLQTGGRHASK